MSQISRLEVKIKALEDEAEALGAYLKTAYEQNKKLGEDMANAQQVANHQLHVAAAKLRGKDAEIAGLIFRLEVAEVLRSAAQRRLALDIHTPCYSCGQSWRPPHQRETGTDADFAAQPRFKALPAPQQQAESGRTQAGGLPDPTAPLATDSTPAGMLG